MSREIKFRAWDVDAELMVDFDDLVHCHTLELFNDTTLIVMQYTGLKDKNGKEICEGDILNWNSLILPINVDTTHSLRFMAGKDWLCAGYAYYGEIIGNIHENPELLTEEK